jgi:tRNA (guanine-N7-)-methyltransferase
MMEQKKESLSIKFLTSEYICLESVADLAEWQRIELDLGCGKGSFAVGLAHCRPETLILAADLLVGRMRKLHKRIERENVKNVLLLRVEARNLLGYMIPDHLLDRLHILCPDPWPKNKHRGNRLLCSDFMTHIHRVLKPGGQFHFSTDDVSYFNIMYNVVEKSGLFDEDNALLAETSGIKTDFEKRWNAQGKEVSHILWVSRPQTDVERLMPAGH